MLLMNLALGIVGLFLSGVFFHQWLTGKGRKHLAICVLEGLAGGLFTIAAIGCAA